MLETYRCKFATRRWSVVLFCNLVDIAELNAYVLFEKLKVDGAQDEKRPLFFKRLGKVFVKSYRRSDATHPSLVTARLLDETQGSPKKLGLCHVCLRLTYGQKGYGCVQCML